MEAASAIALRERLISRCIALSEGVFHMQRLVDNVTCNKATFFSLGLSCVVFLFQVVWRIRKHMG